MRPTPFIIEIPDRPVYKPGSSPAMAPITLQPDDSDTGWVIVDAVDFEGISQYVVTPKDNPAHRRPVKKQHILDWVSPRAYENYEYEQYNKRVLAEKENEIRIIAKDAAVRERKRGMGLVKEQVKVRKPFAKYMQLEQAEDSDRGNTSTQLSSPEHSADERSSGMVPDRSKAIKRKRWDGFPYEKEPAVKRQGFSSSSKASLAWKNWQPPPLKSSQQRQTETTEDEINVDDEIEATPKHNIADTKRLDKFDRPILPTLRRLSNLSRAFMPQESSVSSHSAPSLFIPANASPSILSPNHHRSKPGHGLSASSNYPRSASPTTQLTAAYPNKSNVFRLPNNEETNSPNLPATELREISAPKMIHATSRVAINGLRESSKRGSPKRERHSLFPTDESTVAKEVDTASTKNTSKEVERRNEKILIGRSHLSDSATGHGAKTGEHKSLKQRKDKDSRSSSSGSSNIMRWPKPDKSPNVSGEQSKYFAIMKMKRNGDEVFDGTEDFGDDDENHNEETWDVHGILDDEMRPVNGKLVHHYLCEWVGDWEPSWEPQQNISTDAIKKYENKKRRDRYGFDGAADIELIFESGKASDQKTSRRLNNV